MLHMSQSPIITSAAQIVESSAQRNITNSNLKGRVSTDSTWKEADGSLADLAEAKMFTISGKDNVSG
jgi:hypothetical protein